METDGSMGGSEDGGDLANERDGEFERDSNKRDGEYKGSDDEEDCYKLYYGTWDMCTLALYEDQYVQGT